MFIVKNGPYKTLIKDEHTQIMQPKTMNELTSHDLDKMCLNAKAMNVLYNALDECDLIKIKGCTSAKEIWECLTKSQDNENELINNILSAQMNMKT